MAPFDLLDRYRKRPDQAAHGAILAAVAGLHLALLAALLSYRILLPEAPDGPVIRLDLVPLERVPARTPARGAASGRGGGLTAAGVHPSPEAALLPVPLPELPAPDLPGREAERPAERRAPVRRTPEEVIAEESLTPSVAAHSLAGRGFDLISPPSYTAPHLRNRLPAYPPAARRLGEEGLVILRVLVNPSGASQSVQVYRSSGHPRLDEAAVQAILRWTFVPAERGRRPVMAWLLVPVRFAGGAYVTIDESAVIGG